MKRGVGLKIFFHRIKSVGLSAEFDRRRRALDALELGR